MGKLIGFLITIIILGNLLGIDLDSFKEDVGEVIKSPKTQQTIDQVIEQGSESLIKIIQKGETVIVRGQEAITELEIPVKTVKIVEPAQKQPDIVQKEPEIPVKTVKNDVVSDPFFDNTGWD